MEENLKDAQEWFEEGRKLFNSGRNYEALAFLEQAVKIQPEFYKAWNVKGLALHNLGRSEEAIASYDKALSIQPKDHDAWHNRGWALNNLEEFEEAIASYDKALSIQPKDHEVLFSRGCVLQNLGKLEEALASLDQALEINSDKQIAWLIRGIVLFNLEEFEEAVASYDRTLEIQHDCYEAWYYRGGALEKLKRHEEAIAAYDQALEINPDDHEAWSSQGYVLFILGRLEEAVISFDQAVKINRDDHVAWYNRGGVLKKLGRYEEAVASYDQVVTIQPDYHEAWHNQALALHNLGRYEEAVASYDQALTIKPDYHEAWHNRGWALNNLEKFEEAVASYDQGLSLKPDDYKALNNRGLALMSLEKFEEAIADYDKALSIQLNDHIPWVNRGIAAGKSQHYNPFLALQSSIARQNPKLNKRHFQGRLASYEQGLKHCPKDIDPEGWGKLQKATGDTYSCGCNSNACPSRDLKKALESYQQARETLTAEAFPEEHLEVLQRLIYVYDYLGQAENKQAVVTRGAVVLQALLEKTASDAVKIRLSRKFASFNQFEVDHLVQIAFLDHALEVAEQRKNHCLAWLHGRCSKSKDSPNYDQMQKLLQPFNDKAIVFWHISPDAMNTFIVRYNQPANVVENPNPRNQLSEFEDLMKSWKTQKNLREEMPILLENLTKILNIDAILSRLKNISQLILIPHRDLHLLPLHALFPDNFTITYLPSIKVGLDLQKPQPNTSLLAVVNPTKDLAYAPIEADAVCKLYPKNQRLAESDATKEAVTQALQQNSGIFHFSGHSKHNTNQPAESALILANEERLTLKEILKLNLSQYNLACLCGCETNFTSKDGLIDEFIGLASGFVAAGVNNIIASLWSVNDRSTAYLMVKFHEILERSPTKDIPSALKEAQYWLRNATNEDFEQITLQRGLTRNFEILDQETEAEKLPNNKPFESPYHWAGFCAIGL